MNDTKDKASGAIRDTVGALAGTPTLLAILVLNIIWLGVVGWLAAKADERQESIVQTLLKTCAPGLLRQEGGLKDWKLQSEASEPYQLLGKAPDDGIPFELTPIPYPDL